MKSTKAALEVTMLIADAIRELGSVPSGHLYASVMGHLDLETYNKVIEVLVSAGVVKVESHLLTWVKR